MALEFPTLEARVAAMTDQRRRQIMLDYEAFVAAGVTGDTALRKEAEAYQINVGIRPSYIAMTMRDLAGEVHRYYAKGFWKVAGQLREVLGGMTK